MKKAAGQISTQERLETHDSLYHILSTAAVHAPTYVSASDTCRGGAQTRDSSSPRWLIKPVSVTAESPVGLFKERQPGRPSCLCSVWGSHRRYSGATPRLGRRRPFPLGLGEAQGMRQDGTWASHKETRKRCALVRQTIFPNVLYSILKSLRIKQRHVFLGGEK